MELRQLHYMVALVEEGSVTRAARRLNVVQPAISMQISKLEDELGHRLFQRTPKGMIPTSIGNEAYRLFVPLLHDLRAAKDQLSSLGGKVVGKLSIGVIGSVSNNALSKCLESFCTRYPHVSVRITGGYTMDFMEMLQIGALDLAVINQSRVLTDLVVRPIAREALHLVYAVNNPIKLPDPVPITTIAGLKLVIPSTRHGLRNIIDDAAGGAGARLEPLLEFDELKTIEEFVQVTDFVAILPYHSIGAAVKQGTLRSLAIAPEIARNIACVHNPKRGLLPAAEFFIAELRESMNSA